MESKIKSLVEQIVQDVSLLKESQEPQERIGAEVMALNAVVNAAKFLEKAKPDNADLTSKFKEFDIYAHKDRKDAVDLLSETLEVFKNHNLSVSVAKSFLDCLKDAIEDFAYLPKEK